MLKKEGNETVTNCHGLKMMAADGKLRMTDVADTSNPKISLPTQVNKTEKPNC
jgi:hypothetical protein